MRGAYNLQKLLIAKVFNFVGQSTKQHREKNEKKVKSSSDQKTRNNDVKDLPVECRYCDNHPCATKDTGPMLFPFSTHMRNGKLTNNLNSR